MDTHAAQWIGTTWQESTDKTKLTSRPSPSPPLIEVQTERTALISWYTWNAIFRSWYLELRPDRLQPNQRRATRLNQKLKNLKEWEGFNWNK